MITTAIITICIIGIVAWNRRHSNQRFLAENEARERLGLPQLTRDQFGPTFVEKSAEFRSNINQHM